MYSSPLLSNPSHKTYEMNPWSFELNTSHDLVNYFPLTVSYHIHIIKCDELEGKFGKRRGSPIDGLVSLTCLRRDDLRNALNTLSSCLTF